VAKSDAANPYLTATATIDVSKYDLDMRNARGTHQSPDTLCHHDSGGYGYPGPQVRSQSGDP